MKNKRLVLSSLLAAALLLGLPACSDTPAGGSSRAASKSVSEASEASAAAESASSGEAAGSAGSAAAASSKASQAASSKQAAVSSIAQLSSTTINLGVLNMSSETKIAKLFINGFNKIYPQVKVKVVLINTEYNSDMLKRINSGTLPDVIWTCGDKHTPYSGASTKPFENLTPYFTRDKIDTDDFYKVILDSTKLAPAAKEMYFAPRDYNRPVVFYNKDMFQAAGVAYPKDSWTWDEFLQVCGKLRKAMDDNVAGAAGLRPTSFPLEGNLNWLPSYYPLLKGLGAEFVGGSGQLQFTSAGTVAALKEFETLTAKRYSTSPVAQTSNVFNSKAAAMLIATRPSVTTAVNLGINLDFVMIPKTPGGYIGAGCSGYAISSKSKNKEEAWQFLKYTMSKEGQEAFGETGDSVPVLKSLAQNGTWRKYGGGKYNNAAFVAESNRDLFLNYYYPLKTSSHLNVMNKIADMITKSTDQNSGYSSIEEIAKEYTKIVEAEIK